MNLRCCFVKVIIFNKNIKGSILRGLKGLFLIVFIISAMNTLQAQKVNEWKKIQIDNFSSGMKLNSLKVAEKKYFAALCNTIVPPAFSLDSLNLLKVSSDGGVNWKAVLKDKVTNMDSTFTPLPGKWSARWYTSVEMPSKNLILLLGLEQYDGNQFESHPFIMRSTDFGESWHKIAISKDTLNSSVDCISMHDDNTGILLSGRIPSAEKPCIDGLYKTENGGKDWTEINIGNILNQSISYYAVKAFSDKNYVVIGDKSIISTDDGGVTWKNQTMPYEKDVTYNNVCFLNSKTWFIACKGAATGNGDTNWNVLYKTDDGGNTWKKILYNKTPQDFGLRGVSFYDDLNGMVFTDFNVIKTTDGGTNWVIQILPYDCHLENFGSAVFYDMNKVIVNGQRKILQDIGNLVLVPPTISIKQDTTELLNYKAIWQNVFGDHDLKADKYNFQLAEFEITDNQEYLPSNFEQKIIFENDKCKDTLISLTDKLKFERSYYLRVKAFSGNEQSDWSRIASFVTQKDTSTLLNMDKCILDYPSDQVELKPYKVNFKWNKVKNAQSYSLFVKRLNSTGSLDFQFKNLTDTTKTIDTLLPNTSYIWWVYAYAEGYNKSGSDFRTFSTTDITAINDGIYTDEVSISPNPAEYIIHLSNNNDIIGKKVVIISIEGVIILETEYKENIDVSKFKPGVYFLKIEDKCFKFIKM
jgi:photosystem II stability/assembly factor-like uncharacterized protein